MRLFIPTIGTRLKLVSDWRASVPEESRNETLFKALGWAGFPQMIETELPNVTVQRWHKSETVWCVRRQVDVTPPAGAAAQATNPQVVITGQKTDDYAYRGGYRDYGVAITDEYLLNVTIPAGTIIVVDRIYIRKGMGDFDSITFLIEDSPVKELVSKKNRGFAGKGVRFWVKLDNANEIDCEAI